MRLCSTISSMSYICLSNKLCYIWTLFCYFATNELFLLCILRWITSKKYVMLGHIHVSTLLLPDKGTWMNAGKNNARIRYWKCLILQLLWLDIIQTYEMDSKHEFTKAQSRKNQEVRKAFKYAINKWGRKIHLLHYNKGLAKSKPLLPLILLIISRSLLYRKICHKSFWVVLLVIHCWSADHSIT